jgi:hypothetical protein
MTTAPAHPTLVPRGAFQARLVARSDRPAHDAGDLRVASRMTHGYG